MEFTFGPSGEIWANPDLTVIAGCPWCCTADQPVTTGCCANPIPATLYVTVEACVGAPCADCPSCLPMSFPIVYNSGTGRWEGSKSCTYGACTFTYEARLSCIPAGTLCHGTEDTTTSRWCYGWTGSFAGTCSPCSVGNSTGLLLSNVVCDPYSVSFSHPAFATCLCHNLDVTITE